MLGMHLSVVWHTSVSLACVGSQGSQGLFKLGRGRGLGGIGTVVSGSFRGEEALALFVGYFEVLLEHGPSLFEWGEFMPVAGCVGEDIRFLQDDSSLADSEGFRDRVIAGKGETATFSDALPEPFQGIFRVPLPVQRGGILIQLIGRDPAVRFVQVCQELQAAHLAVAPQWVVQFVDKGVIDCREEL
jgi:hypothetical protein